MKHRQSCIQTAMFVLVVIFAHASTTTYEKCVTAKDLETINSNMEKLAQQLGERITEQNEKISQQQGTILHLAEKLRRHETNLAKSLQTKPETKNQFSSFGCLDDVLSLTCPDNRQIYITYAEFGRHHLTCSDPCCAPNPQYDCTENVATNAPEDFISIKYLCDNQTSCSYEYNGATISECQAGYIADYLQIFYDCLPEPNELVVGFTAWAYTTRSYQEDQTVLFDVLDSNFGGHYNPTASIFTCPYHGTYIFSVNILASEGDRMYATIMKEGTLLATAFADDIESTFNQASATVVTECIPGQLVWIKSRLSGVMLGNSNRYSHFTGYLMQRLD